jgi:NADPH:quinone reductase-like Zn-dependent oxidoreductase
MKAIVYREYGGPDVLKMEEIKTPSPEANEVLIKVHAVSVNFGDLMARKFRNISPKEFNMPLLFWMLARFGFGFRSPKISILGNSFSGEIESIGKEVKQFKIGDKVFGYTGEKMGAYAEYLCLPENGILALKPSNKTPEEASVLPYGALMAINILKKANIQKGQKVLIIGASGGIGSAAVQLAKHHFGAEVTGVCGTPRMMFVKKLGADKVIDYKKEDFTKNGETYDLIIDILGKGTFSACKNSLNQKGIYLLASFKTKKLLQMLWTGMTGQKKVVCAMASPAKQDLLFLKQLVEEGKIKSIIGKSFSLDKAAEAHSYAESGKKQGDVVIQI